MLSAEVVIGTLWVKWVCYGSKIKRSCANCSLVRAFHVHWTKPLPYLSKAFWHQPGWCEGAVYLTSLGRPADIGLQLGKACYPCSG